jgi:hypothetical protein
MEKYEEVEILRALQEWAYSYPRKDRPFLIFMGRSFTPVEYELEVRENGEFRSALFRFLEEQAERSREKPINMLIRAVEANRL